MNPRTDAQLMDRTRAGDREAFGELVDRHKHAMVNTLTRLSGDRSRGEDLAQEAFVRLWHARDRYREQGCFPAWLYRIATNLLRQEERRRRRWRLLAPALSHTACPPGGGPQEGLLRQEARDQVSAALAALPLKYRAPLVLRELEGWAYRDIAAAVGTREGTIKSRINRGRRLLRLRLEPYRHTGVTRHAARTLT